MKQFLSTAMITKQLETLETEIYLINIIALFTFQWQLARREAVYWRSEVFQMPVHWLLRWPLQYVSLLLGYLKKIYHKSFIGGVRL